MTLISTTLPADGQVIVANDVNVPFNAILGAVNGHLDTSNVTPGGFAWSVMGAISKSIPASSMQDSANLETFASEQTNDAVLSGCVLTFAVGTLNWSLSAGVVRIGGKRVVVNAATGSVAALQDTYFSINQSGTVSYTGANAVANGAASPALPALSLWAGLLVSGASAITLVNMTGIDSNGVLLAPKRTGSKQTDQNGWAVRDSGGLREYTKRWVGLINTNLGSNASTSFTTDNLPVGVTNTSAMHVQSTYGGGNSTDPSIYAQLTSANAAGLDSSASTLFRLTLHNVYSGGSVPTGYWTLYISLRTT